MSGFSICFVFIPSYLIRHGHKLERSIFTNHKKFCHKIVFASWPLCPYVIWLSTIFYPHNLSILISICFSCWCQVRAPHWLACHKIRHQEVLVFFLWADAMDISFLFLKRTFSLSIVAMNGRSLVKKRKIVKHSTHSKT